MNKAVVHVSPFAEGQLGLLQRNHPGTRDQIQIAFFGLILELRRDPAPYLFAFPAEGAQAGTFELIHPPLKVHFRLDAAGRRCIEEVFLVG